MLRAYGGPEVLTPDTVEVGDPGAGEVRVRQTAIGANYHDVYVRSGLYTTLTLPGLPGIEAVGVVTAVGHGVGGIAPGDRIGYITDRYGAYASERVLSADLAVALPATMDDRVTATVLLKGLTAEMLVRRVHQIEPGMVVLVHAAAGGVGRVLCQWASAFGATLIGTAGAPEKRDIARGPMPPERLAWVTELLEAHPFRLATTMRHNPHWYTLRHEWWDVGGDVFTEVVTAIREHGYTEDFGGCPWRMLDVNGYKYWSYFSAAPEAVFVLNRKPLGPLTPQEEADLRVE